MIAAVMGLWALALIVIAIRWPLYLVPAAIVCSVFEGAAIINAGGLGISPYYFTLMLIAVHCVFLRVSAENFLGFSSGVRPIIAVAFVLLILCVGSAVVMPRVFSGWPVLSPRLSADAQAPLEFSTSNIGQAVYLLLNVLMLWYAAQTCLTPQSAISISKAFFAAGIIVVGLAGYQLISSLTGLPFPDDLLYSNDAYVMQHGTSILDMPRICSTFTEPSSLAVFLVAFIAFLIATLETAVRKWRIITLLISACCMLVLSTSSTAYIGLAALAVWVVWKYIFVPAINGRGSIKVSVVITLLIGATVTTFVMNDTLRDLLQKTVFEKDQSSSYEERSLADRYSMQLAERTWGLGVGLGSNRASSFLPSLLSSIGLYGTLLLTALVVLLVRMRGIPASSIGIHRPFASGLIAIIGAKVISSPDLATPLMWVLMAGLLCVRASAEKSNPLFESFARPHLVIPGTGVGI